MRCPRYLAGCFTVVLAFSAFAPLWAVGSPPTLSDASLAIVAQAGGKRLAEPYPLSPSGARVPYGSRVRLTVRAQDVDGDLIAVAASKRLPAGYLQEGLTEEELERDIGHYTILFDHGGSGDAVAGDGIWSREFVVPIDLYKSTERLHLPGTYILRLCAVDSAGNQSSRLDIPLEVVAPEASSGAPPVIERVWTEPEVVSGPPGTPYLLKARVRDADGDVVWVPAVLPEAEGSFQMADDGSLGDQVAGDGVYTRVRMIGDWFDVFGSTERRTEHIVVRAFDAAGNVSDPVTATVEARYDEGDPVLTAPLGAGPRVCDVWCSAHTITPLGVWRVTAQADSPDVYVVIYDIISGYYDLMLDDGCEWDAQRGDGIYSWGDHFRHEPPRLRPYVIYAVPKSGPPVTGAKVTVTLVVVKPSGTE